jgi:hypothetical protein
MQKNTQLKDLPSDPVGIVVLNPLHPTYLSEIGYGVWLKFTHTPVTNDLLLKVGCGSLLMI